MSSSREQLEEAIAVCRDALSYFEAQPPGEEEDKKMVEQANAIVFNLEPLLSRVYLKTKAAQMATYPCQQNAEHISELLAAVKDQGTAFGDVRFDLAEEFESLLRNSEFVKSAAASRDTIIT